MAGTFSSYWRSKFDPMYVANADGELVHPKGKPLDELGREVLDNVPMAPPVGYNPQPSMVDRIRDMVRSELLKREALEAGMETFEEAEDFDTGEDDFDPLTPYEAVFEPPADVRTAPPAPAPSSEVPPASAESASVPPADGQGGAESA